MRPRSHSPLRAGARECRTEEAPRLSARPTSRAVWRSCGALLALWLLAGCDSRRTVILIADAGNGRIVQMDDFSGAGWTTFAYPQVNTTLIAPTSVAVDSRGRIYAANTGDDNISRMEGIGGGGFVTYGR